MTNATSRPLFIVLLVITGLAGGCFLEQKLDESAASNSKRATSAPVRNSGAGGAGSTGASTTASTSSSTSATTGAGGGVSPSQCDTTRAQARAILVTNCARCHQMPHHEGQFDFILDLDKLKANEATTRQKFIVKSDLDNSRLYVRMKVGEMPPPLTVKSPRPSSADIQVIANWLTSCYDGSGGWEPPDGGDIIDPPDAGDGGDPIPEGCGDPRQPCCTANVCNNGGCCVYGTCRANGATCTAAAGGIGLFGTCTDGSCDNSMGARCGSVGQTCCDNSSCTQARSACLVGMTTCSACGDNGQPCCKAGSAQTCLEGNACIGAAVGRTGNCQTCGGMGQPCCGVGVAAQKTCNPGLTCALVAAMGDRCGP